MKHWQLVPRTESRITFPFVSKTGCFETGFFLAINSRKSQFWSSAAGCRQNLFLLKNKTPSAQKAKRSKARTKQEHGTNGQAPFRPLTLERRKSRDLSNEAAAQLQELELLAQSLLQGQEAKQQSVSRELHDNIAQVLTAVTNRMTMARTATKLPAWLRQELLDLQQHVESALTDIRLLARELRPALLDHCGLVAALEKHADSFRQRTRIALELEVDPEAARLIDPADLTHLFRLAQEALQNVEEHSGAARAWLTIVRNGDAMHLEVGDDGCGFTPDRITEAQGDGHLGLLGMRERAELLGGSFHLQTAPANGTTIRVQVPFSAKGSPEKPPTNATPSPEFQI